MGRPFPLLGLGDGDAHHGMICDASFPTFYLQTWESSSFERELNPERGHPGAVRQPAERGASMCVAAVQFPVRMDVNANLRDLEAAVAALAPKPLAVAPEGRLSGHLPQAGFTAQLDGAVTARALERAREMSDWVIKP